MIKRSVSLAALAMVGLSACTPMSPASAASADASTVPLGIDLGGARSRAPANQGAATVQTALVGEGHERGVPEGSSYQLVHEGHDDAHATGKVNAVDAAQHKVTISHDPIPEIGWPAMTMEFPVAPSIDLEGIKPGSRVTFTIEKGKDGMYQVRSLAPAGDPK